MAESKEAQPLKFMGLGLLEIGLLAALILLVLVNSERVKNALPQ
jgi:hypothetical protein